MHSLITHQLITHLADKNTKIWTLNNFDNFSKLPQILPFSTSSFEEDHHSKGSRHEDTMAITNSPPFSPSSHVRI